MKIASSITDSRIVTADNSLLVPKNDYVVTVGWVNVPNWAFVLPVNGSYTISASTSGQVNDADADGSAHMYVRLALNGRAIPGTMRRLSHNITSGSLTLPIELSITKPFGIGDIITLQAYKPDAGDVCTVCGDTGSLGAVPNFSYQLHSTFIPITSEIITAWQNEVLTITASTPPTKGTPTKDQCYWRRVGKNMELMYMYIVGSGGANGTGSYRFILPNGRQIDATLGVVNYQTFGGALVNDAGALGLAVGQVIFQSADGVSIQVVSPTSTYTIGSAYYGLGSSPYISFHASVPIVGWG